MGKTVIISYEKRVFQPSAKNKFLSLSSMRIMAVPYVSPFVPGVAPVLVRKLLNNLHAELHENHLTDKSFYKLFSHSEG